MSNSRPIFRCPRSKFGLMQGRLSPQVNGKIQCFPSDHWQIEFLASSIAGLSLIEWTLDQDGLFDNPLMSSQGRSLIRLLSSEYDVRVESVTADCFMQAPLWASRSRKCQFKGQYEFMKVIESCYELGSIEVLVVPLVDNGSLDSIEKENRLLDFLNLIDPDLEQTGVKLAFESDFEPSRLSDFLGKLNPRTCGVNLDIGNSASHGWSPLHEFELYHSQILNIHIKDRILGGETVKLGKGCADFSTVFRMCSKFNYSGNFILQVARAVKGEKHMAVIDQSMEFLREYALLEE